MKPESRHYYHKGFITVPYECKEILDELGYKYIKTLEPQDCHSIAVWFWDNSYMLVESSDTDFRYVTTEHLEALVQILDEDARHYYMRHFNLGVYSDAHDEMLKKAYATNIY